MSAASSPARPAAALGLIALAAVSWGTTGAVTTLLVSRAAATPLVVGAGRMLVEAVLLLAAARLMTGAVRAAPGDGWRCLALGACMAAFQVTYFTAVTRAGIAVTALVAICSAPIMIAALAAALLGERPTPRLALALVLGVGGTALLVTAPVAGTTAASAERRASGARGGTGVRALRGAGQGRSGEDGAAGARRAHLRRRGRAHGARVRAAGCRDAARTGVGGIPLSRRGHDGRRVRAL